MKKGHALAGENKYITNHLKFLFSNTEFVLHNPKYETLKGA
jgi:hypothetical protein